MNTENLKGVNNIILGTVAHFSYVSNPCNLILLIFFANLHVMRQFRLSRMMIPRKAAILGDAQSLEEIVQIDGNLQIRVRGRMS